jgi:GT2 family glycosyltransferase
VRQFAGGYFEGSPYFGMDATDIGGTGFAACRNGCARRMSMSADFGGGLISISVVSHSQMALVLLLMQDLQAFCVGNSLELILTINQHEEVSFSEQEFSFPISVIRNPSPQGFGVNHNHAFRRASGDFFCVLNPDVRLRANPFPGLLDCFAEKATGLAAPLVTNARGGIENSARRVPSPMKLAKKVLGVQAPPDYAIGEEKLKPDWVAGMFMLFPSAIYRQLGGFDERYFLYYEDVDICLRLHLQGIQVLLCPRVQVIHHAQRSSHTDFRYFRWHLASMLRFFRSAVYWRFLRSLHANAGLQ